MDDVKEFCTRPFEEIEIHDTGEVYTCCPNWNKFFSIGNIHKSSFEEIWNGEKAVDLRKRVMNKDYSLCDEQSCRYLSLKYFRSPYTLDYKPVMTEYPQIVKFVYDIECNIACKICRDKVTRLSDEELNKLNSKIDTFLDLLKSAKKLIINAKGDPFGSRHSRLVIKEAATKYPNLKFDFHTNGILCNEKNFKELNITPDKIAQIRISIHAATPKTYGKIVPGGEKLFPQIIKNLEYLKKLKEKYGFQVYIHFVINSLNYKEIVDFIKLAEKVNASPHFWEVRQENCRYQLGEDAFIAKDNHPLHKDLLKVLKHPKVKQYKDNFSPVFYDFIK